MVEVVINKCFGGFGLSPLGVKTYLELKGKTPFFYVHKEPFDFKNPVYKRFLGGDNCGVVFCILKDLGDEPVSFPNEFYFSYYDIPRDDPDLVKTVRLLGVKANDSCAELRVVFVPDDVKWIIDEYDGSESVEEAHRSWG